MAHKRRDSDDSLYARFAFLSIRFLLIKTTLQSHSEYMPVEEGHWPIGLSSASVTVKP